MSAMERSVKSIYLNHLLAGAQRAISTQLKKELAPFEITPVQYGILQCLSETDIRTPKEIASYLGIDCPSLSVNLDKLEKKGLIKRRIDTSDRRCVLIELTETSRRMQCPVQKAVTEAENRILGQFDGIDADRLCDLLSRITALAV